MANAAFNGIVVPDATAKGTTHEHLLRIVNQMLTGQVLFFANTADRAVQLANAERVFGVVPRKGTVCYLEDRKRHETYDGSGWAPLPGLAADCSYTTAGDLASTTGAETAMAAWTADASFTIRNARIYALTCQCLVYNTAGAFGTIERAQIRVRKAVNSTSAQQLSIILKETYGSGVGGATGVHWVSYIANTTGADLTNVHLGLTVERTTGANTNRIYGDASFPAIIAVEDIGLTTNNPNLLAIAVDIT